MVCNKCGWAHFGVSEEYAHISAKNYIEYYESLSDLDKINYYGTLVQTESEFFERYKSCFSCGNDYKDFHTETPKDIISDGVTLQPIIIVEQCPA